MGIVANLEAIERKLAADDHRRAANSHPALIVIGRFHQRVRLAADDLVERGVENLDYLAIFHDGARDEDGLPEARSDALGKRGFAVAGFAVKEQTGAGVDRGTKAVEDVFVDRDVVEGLLQLLAARTLGADGLGFNRQNIFGKGDRGGAYIGTGGHGRLWRESAPARSG